MEIKVLGCHGGETPKHRTSSFLLDGVLGIDAGATTAALSLREQKRLEAVLVSHAHLDHVRDLATLADNRCQMGGRPLVVAGTPWTLSALKKHFFNNVLWPDFTKIPLSDNGGMTVEYLPMRPERVYEISGYRARAVLVSHTIESAAFIVERAGASIAYSGDTGPTERFWELLRKETSLRALLMEVSFPNEMLWLAKASGHHTPATLEKELNKLRDLPNARELPILLYHIKPHFQREVEREVAKIKRRELDVLSLDEELIV
jgi:3',5'-cyclic-nucleotide phosphodiesterase